jgi:hypothetical protein
LISTKKSEPDRTVISDRTVVLTQSNRTAIGQDFFVAPGVGKQSYTVYQIDTRAFTNGGTLIIDLAIGGGESAASFDLFPAGVQIPTEGRPVASLAGAYDIGQARLGPKSVFDRSLRDMLTRARAPEKATLRYSFSTGEVFRLGATGNWGSRAGTSNSFSFKVAVVD